MLLVDIVFTIGLIIGLFTLYAPTIQRWARASMAEYEAKLAQTDPQAFQKLKMKYKR